MVERKVAMFREAVAESSEAMTNGAQESSLSKPLSMTRVEFANVRSKLRHSVLVWPLVLMLGRRLRLNYRISEL